MFHDLTRGQKRALRAAAELARQQDRQMTAEDAEAYYLDVRNSDLPLVVGAAVARGVIAIEDVGDVARELVADLAERLRAVDAEMEKRVEPRQQDEYDPQAAVSVAAIVNQIDAISDTATLYVNRVSGDLRIVDPENDDWDDDDDEAEENDEGGGDIPEWLAQEEGQSPNLAESPDWVALLDRFDVDEYDIMRRFARNARPAASRDLEDALHGKGAFRRFRDVVHRRGLDEEWYRFRDERLSDLVKWTLKDRAVRFRK